MKHVLGLFRILIAQCSICEIRTAEKQVEDVEPPTEASSRLQGRRRRDGLRADSNGSVILETGARTPRVMAASTPSFSADVAPIFEKNCLACHSSSVHKSGLILESYSALMKGGKHGPSILAHDANGSRIIQMLEGDIDPQMPAGGDPLPASDIARIKAWIDAGAEGPPASEAAPALKAPTAPDIHPEVAVVSPVTAIKFSPDGRVLAVGGYREVRLIDPASGSILATLSGHSNYVRSLAFSPDGKMLAAAGGSPQLEGEIKNGIFSRISS